MQSGLSDDEWISHMAAQVRALEQGLTQQRFLHVAGRDPHPQLRELFRQRPEIVERENAEKLNRLGRADLATRVMELFAEEAAAEAEERWRSAEAEVRGQGPDGSVRLSELARQAPVTPERSRRRALGQAWSEAEMQLSSPREEAIDLRARHLAGVATSTGQPKFEERIARCSSWLALTEAAYFDVLAWEARRQLELRPTPRGDLQRVDLLYLATLPMLKGLFDQKRMRALLEPLCQKLALPLQQVTVRQQSSQRLGQWAGIHRFGSRISVGGPDSPANALRVFSAALSAGAEIKFQQKFSDDSGGVLASAVGQVFIGLLYEPRFLKEELEVERPRQSDVIRAIRWAQQFDLRCHAVAALVAAELQRGVTIGSFRRAHAENFTKSLGARWNEATASRDGSIVPHVAAIEAAQLAEVLRSSLREHCDEDYWRNPRCAAVLVDLIEGNSGSPI